MTRPRLFTISALLLAYLAAGGLAVAVWASRIDVRASTQLAFVLVGIGYGVSAGASSVGLWRMRPWLGTALRAWAIAVAFVVLLPLLVVKAELSVGLQLIVSALMGAGIWWLAGYLQSRYAAIATGAA